MKRKNVARNALFTSIISLLLCVSMLVGTTFAWFTDEVKSGMNTIAAGNLDIELVHTNANVTNESVAGNTEMFRDLNGKKILWEPGVVAYEKLTVKNVGSLALEYQMSLNIFDENNLNGHKLSEVLQVAIIDGSAVNMSDRAAVLAAAKAAAENKVGGGLLSNFHLSGKLEPNANSAEQTVVIFWEPNDNAIDNLYNANNGQVTSDGEALHINFGVNLQATQMMHEDDSFGKDYDFAVDNTPYATIVPLGELPVKATAGIGGAASEITLDAAFQYEPTLSAAEVAESAYKYYVADFFVYADKDVPAESIALAGYYDAWCQYNDDNWVALTSPDAVAAGKENGVRLIEGMSQDGIHVHYKDICEYGNDGTGFLCGIADLTGANAGTTVTVELRLYETDADPAGSSASTNETGEYIVVSTAKYTFPVETVESVEDLKSVLETGAKEVKLAAGTYSFPNSSLSEGTTLYCEPGTVFESGAKLNIDGATIVGATFQNAAQHNTVNGTYKDCTFTGSNGLRWGYAGDTVVFENCVFSGNTYGAHIDSGASEVIFKNCTFSGFNAMGKEITKLTLEGCTFVGNGKSAYNGINLWGDTELKNCTFVFDGSSQYEWVEICSVGKTASFENCVVTNGQSIEDVASAREGGILVFK